MLRLSYGNMRGSNAPRRFKPDEAQYLLDQYRVVAHIAPTTIAQSLSVMTEDFYTVLFLGDTQAQLNGLTYHRSEKIHEPDYDPDNPISLDERVGLQINILLRNFRVFGFEKTRDAYSQFANNAFRNSKGKDEVCESVFHCHFGGSPTYVIEFQHDHVNKVIAVTGLAVHENFDYQKKIVPCTTYADAYRDAVAARMKAHEDKILRYTDCENDIATHNAIVNRPQNPRNKMTV